MATDTTPSPVAYSLEAFGEAYSICLSKTYRLIRSGDLPAFKFGRRTLIKRSDAEAWAKKAWTPIPARDFAANSGE